MTTSQLSEGFRGFAKLGGYQVTQDGDTIAVQSEPGGEIRYFVRPTDGTADGPDGSAVDPAGRARWTLTRAERREDEQRIMSAQQLSDIELMLTALVGVDVRSAQGLPHLARPFWPADAVGGLQVSAAPDGFTLTGPDGVDNGIRFARDTGGAGAAGFSQLVGYSPAQVREAFLGADGSPLES